MIWILLFGIAMLASVAHALYDERKKRKQAEQERQNEDPIWEYARHLGDSTAVCENKKKGTNETQLRSRGPRPHDTPSGQP